MESRAKLASWNVCSFIYMHTGNLWITCTSPEWSGMPSPCCLSQILSLAWHRLPRALCGFAILPVWRTKCRYGEGTGKASSVSLLFGNRESRNMLERLDFHSDSHEPCDLRQLTFHPGFFFFIKNSAFNSKTLWQPVAHSCSGREPSLHLRFSITWQRYARILTATYKEKGGIWNI